MSNVSGLIIYIHIYFYFILRNKQKILYIFRIDTPPEHDRIRNKGTLRGNKYGVVPPVQKRTHQ
jgi:hypothetical protein